MCEDARGGRRTTSAAVPQTVPLSGLGGIGALSVFKNSPSKRSWLAIEPQRSRCFYLPNTRITICAITPCLEELKVDCKATLCQLSYLPRPWQQSLYYFKSKPRNCYSCRNKEVISASVFLIGNPQENVYQPPLDFGHELYLEYDLQVFYPKVTHPAYSLSRTSFFMLGGYMVNANVMITLKTDRKTVVKAAMTWTVCSFYHQSAPSPCHVPPHTP